MLPDYLAKAVPNPMGKRAPWYANTAPTYAGIFLWIAFYQQMAGGTLQHGGLGLCLVALAVAANIVWTGYQLMRRSAAGLMDISLPEEKLAQIESLLAGYRHQGLNFHALRTRQAGGRAFVTLHVLVPGQWTVQIGHDWAERIETDICKALPHTHVTTHLEPMEDPASMNDQDLDRNPPPSANP